MKQRDLVWVRIPFSDGEQSKHRPALVLSNDDYNRRHDDVLVCAVTSNLQPTKYKVPIQATDLEAGRLPRSSMVRADKILPVEKELVDRPIGRLRSAAYDAVVAALDGLVKRQV